ncbi:AMIN-like domain-containing (lipo)protein [Kribbella aluminosa]|uniref:AMIN-like domain-containing (lipo)protein n=1 Tax=Kribbella aluminosa TaxID=416017 RepID=UPI003CD0C3F6
MRRWKTSSNSSGAIHAVNQLSTPCVHHSVAVTDRPRSARDRTSASTIGLGVRARLPFRVCTLVGPGSDTRLVVDVAHQW